MLSVVTHRHMLHVDAERNKYLAYRQDSQLAVAILLSCVCLSAQALTAIASLRTLLATKTYGNVYRWLYSVLLLTLQVGKSR